MDDRRDDRARRASRLEALGRATEDLAPSDALSEAVMSRVARVESASTKALSDEAESPLLALARATESMDLADAFSDAVMVRVLSEEPLSRATESQTTEPAEALVERLARLTNDIAPTDAFSEAVMSALPSTSPSNPAPRNFGRSEVSRSDTATGATKTRENRAWADIVTRSSRPVLFVTAAVAALCVLFSSYAERNLYPDVISSVDPVEVTE